jgi:hypothetical protein
MEVKVDWHGKEVKKELEALVRERLFTAGELVKNEAIRSMRDDPKTGRFYYGRSGRYYRASAAEESPAVDTGSLIRSMSTMPVEDELAVLVGTMDLSKHDSLYNKGVSWWLEKGWIHKNGLPVAPRPFLRPALHKMAATIKKLFASK